MNLAIGNWEFSLAGPLVMTAALLLAIGLVLALLGSWRRLYSRSKARWLLVLVLNVAAAAGLVLLLTPPVTMVESDRTAILLTEGTGTDAATGGDLFVAPGATAPDKAAAAWLLDPAQAPLRDPALSRLEVLGHGLEEAQWRNFPATMVIDFQPPALAGLANLAWARQIQLGQHLEVSGTYLGEQDSIMVRLLDPAGQVAQEVRVPPGSDFTLVAMPRAPGNLQYRLQAVLADTVMLDEALGVVVEDGRAVNITVLQSAPSFETRQLKNWAADRGSVLTVITQISQSHSISQSVNLPAGQTLEFSPGTLVEQDLLIIDGRALANLPGQQRRWLENAVRDGMGLLVLVDQDLADALPELQKGLLAGFNLSPAPGDRAETTPVWAGTTSPDTLPLAGFNLTAPGGVALTVDATGQVLDLFREFGMGRVALSILRERHRWLTSGNSALYTNYWAMLMRGIARPDPGPRLQPPSTTVLETPGRRSQICATPAPNPLLVQIESPAAFDTTTTEAVLAEDAMGSSRACTMYWPEVAGWHRYSLVDSNSGEVIDTAYRRIYADTEWLSERRFQRQNATHRRAATISEAGATTQPRRAPVPIAPFWPWLLFVLSASALWVERKLDFDW
jgi:hypothetical protein